MNLLEELLLISRTVATALALSLVWVIPLFVYRYSKGQSLLPEPDDNSINISKRRTRNAFIQCIVYSAGFTTLFFMLGMRITGVLFSAMGLYLLIYFEVADRKRSKH